ncbi:MAG: 30S ribosomal protein S13 [Parcubacteria group bacterium GW2011_GWC2_45_7]|nr:MAG: 30S ribosomal protein S13 [Parcubacteria group bacterium GW2011_GWC2_45_7]
MAIRISGIVLPEKRLEVALTYIFGIGQSRARKILRETSIDLNKRPKDLSEAEVALLRGMIDKNYRVEGELRREIMNNIKRLKEIGTRRGSRHMKRLPIKGRTKTNSRTTRGNVRKTMGSGRRSAVEKT